MEVVSKVSVEFPETRKFMDEKLEHKCSKENVFIEEFSLTSQANIFLLCSVRL